MIDILLSNVVLDGAVCDVAIENGLFSSIAGKITAPAAKVIDCKGRYAITPAFYNTHTHHAMTLLRGYADDLELFDWLNNHIWPAEALLTEEDVYAGARLAILEMIKSGTVFFNDSYWHPRATAKAAVEMGVKAEIGLLYLSIADGSTLKNEQNEALLDMADELPARVRISHSPHAIYTVSTERLRRAAEDAASDGRRIHIHAAETSKEFEDCMKEHNATPIAYLNLLGVLTPKTILAHCVHLTDDDRRIIAETGAVIAHNPVSNQKLCSGIFDWKRASEAGCCITIGTDGCSSNNNLSMFDEMKCAALSAKVSSMDPKCGKAADILRAATVTAANAFGFKSGVISEGYEADALLIDLERADMVGDYNLISNLVYSASGDAVDSVICGGRLLMEHRIVPGEAEIIASAREVCRKISRSVKQ